MIDLFRRSVEIILANQHPSGAYVACPSFPTYRYCWYRDGAFIAYSMDLAGQHESAARFHVWAAEAIRRRRQIVLRAIEKAGRGKGLLESDILHTRYTLEGDDAGEPWQNFQLDGFGTWLWALAEHVEITGDADLLRQISESIQLVAAYLSALWQMPNYDCWEEHPGDLHPYTLGAIYGGLQAIDRLREGYELGGIQLEIGLLDRMRGFVLTHGIREGHFIKRFRPPEGSHPTSSEAASAEVDASLIGLATPYRLLPPDDEMVRDTIERIESDLRCSGGGLHRYLADTYYGGGEWILLAGWLGWHFAQNGRLDRARELLAWIEAQADEVGRLPEQVSTHLLAPEYLDVWKARWGPVAKPLLWSHAMYIILHRALEDAGASVG